MILVKKIPQIILSLMVAITLLHTQACQKKEAPPPERVEPTPEPIKTSLPVSQLQGLTINSKPLTEISSRSGDPQVLDAQDLMKAFDIKNTSYLERAMQLIQSQIQSGSPLKYVSVFLGTAPQGLAEKCLENVSSDLCLIEPYAFNCTDALQQKNWSEENYQKICQSLGKLKAFKPKLLVTVFDGDNTMWYQDVSNAGVRQGVESKRIYWAKDRAELLGVFPKPEERQSYQAKKTPYEYYKELYKAVGALWNYNYAALAFRGLSLNEIYKNSQEMAAKPFAPIGYPEMVDLLKYLNGEGIVAGVVSASPIFGVIPTVESLGTGVPLDRIEGLDVFVKDPQKPDSKPVRLSRLINQGKVDPNTGNITKFKNYQEVLETYGNWVMVDVDHVINARGGKGVQSRSIARRHVAETNRKAIGPDEKIDIEDMRLVLVGGDNFAPATDIQTLEGDRVKQALEGGNDQGLSEGMNFLETGFNVPGKTDILFIRRYELGEDQKVTPKKGKLENFEGYVAQQRLLRPNRVGEILVQGAVTDVKALGGEGGFLKQASQEAPETQPSATVAPETQPSLPSLGESPSPKASPSAQTSPAPKADSEKLPEAAGAKPPAAIPPAPPAPPRLDQLP